MRRISLAILATTTAMALGAGIPTSSAQDISAAKKPAAVGVYNWSGCYLGGHLGAGWAETGWTATGATFWGFPDLQPGQGFSQTKSGFVGGGQLGCNYQTGQWVFGLEGTLAGSTIKGDLTNTVFRKLPFLTPDDVFTTKVRTLLTVVGRMGYAWQNWLLYMKGGYAGADVSFSVSDTVAIFKGAGSGSGWHNGWTLGLGTEYGLNANWIVGIEYDYMRFGTKNYNVGGGTATYLVDVRPRDVHEALFRISYKFR